MLWIFIHFMISLEWENRQEMEGGCFWIWRFICSILCQKSLESFSLQWRVFIKLWVLEECQVAWWQAYPRLFGKKLGYLENILWGVHNMEKSCQHKNLKKLYYATTPIQVGVQLLSFEVHYKYFHKKNEYTNRFVEN